MSTRAACPLTSFGVTATSGLAPSTSSISAVSVLRTSSVKSGLGTGLAVGGRYLPRRAEVDRQVPGRR